MNFKIDRTVVRKIALERMAQRIKSVRCPEHGKSAQIVASGNDQFEVSGCCDKLIAAVEAKFK